MLPAALLSSGRKSRVVGGGVRWEEKHTYLRALVVLLAGAGLQVCMFFVRLMCVLSQVEEHFLQVSGFFLQVLTFFLQARAFFLQVRGFFCQVREVKRQVRTSVCQAGIV